MADDAARERAVARPAGVPGGPTRSRMARASSGCVPPSSQSTPMSSAAATERSSSSARSETTSRNTSRPSACIAPASSRSVSCGSADVLEPDVAQRQCRGGRRRHPGRSATVWSSWVSMKMNSIMGSSSVRSRAGSRRRRRGRSRARSARRRERGSASSPRSGPARTPSRPRWAIRTSVSSRSPTRIVSSGGNAEPIEQGRRHVRRRLADDGLGAAPRSTPRWRPASPRSRAGRRRGSGRTGRGSWPRSGRPRGPPGRPPSASRSRTCGPRTRPRRRRPGVRGRVQRPRILGVRRSIDEQRLGDGQDPGARGVARAGSRSSASVEDTTSLAARRDPEVGSASPA